MNRYRIVILIFALAYIASYSVLRTRNAEAWPADGRVYVIFPKASPWLYYLFRPISYLDGIATGMRFHIGPHATD